MHSDRDFTTTVFLYREAADGRLDLRRSLTVSTDTDRKSAIDAALTRAKLKYQGYAVSGYFVIDADVWRLLGKPEHPYLAAMVQIEAVTADGISLGQVNAS